MIVIPVILPLSLLYNIYSHLRFKYTFYMKSSPKHHAQKVARVVSQMKAANGVKMCTARPGYESTSLFQGEYKKVMHKIDLSDFIDILDINTKKGTVTVEPGVTCGQLSHALLAYGWTMEVVPELDDLTVGGLIMGFGVETSSHKYGLFQHTCEQFEVALPGGVVERCSRTHNEEMFYSIPWSYGTIGFLLSAEVRIVPCKKYCKIQYIPYFNKEEYLEAFENASNERSNDFVECLVYEENKAILMVGKMTDEASFWKIHRIGSFWGPWFYKHAAKYFDSGKGYEFIPLRDYYHRHTRSLFWEMEDIIPFGNNLLFRIVLGWLIPPKVSFLKLTTPPELHELYEKKHIVEDYLVPISKLSETLTVVDELITFYPLWLCPCRIPVTKYPGLVNPVDPQNDMYVDVGIYGVPAKCRDPTVDWDFYTCHKKAEEFIRKIGGFQALYAQTYQSREEFEEMFNHKLYNEVRTKYNCNDSLPVVYDKVSRAARK